MTARQSSSTGVSHREKTLSYQLIEDKNAKHRVIE